MTDFMLADLLPLAPELLLAVSGLFLLVLGVFLGDRASGLIGWLTVAVFAGAFALLATMGWGRQVVLNDLFVMDGFAGLVKLVILAGLAVSVALSIRHIEEDRFARFEYPLLVLFAGLGMLVMVSANDMLSLYMGLELQSLALYVLAAIRRDSARASEAGLKYFVLGALSSGMLLFGASLIYGYTGSTNFDVIGQTLAGQMSMGALIGMVFVLAGIAFKISAAPFHMWTPDVYEGAPTSVTAFFALVPKMAAMALLIRLVFEAFGPAVAHWQQIIWLLAALSMAVGAFAALKQDNIKRLLAYSSIGNMGFALVGLAAANAEGTAAVLVYMMIYMVMTAGTFAVLLCLRKDDTSVERIADLAGLSKTAPVMAYALAILMFSMSGIPPLAGFFAKFLVFKAAVGVGMYGLAVFGVLTSVVAAYYYLRVIKVMFFDEPEDRATQPVTPFARRAVAGLSVAFILVFVIMPSPLLDISREAVRSFFNG